MNTITNKDKIRSLFTDIKIRQYPKDAKSGMYKHLTNYALMQIAEAFDKKGVIVPKFPYGSTVWVIDEFDKTNNYSRAFENVHNYNKKGEIEFLIRECKVCSISLVFENDVRYKVQPKESKGSENFTVPLRDLYIGRLFFECELFKSYEDARQALAEDYITV